MKKRIGIINKPIARKENSIIERCISNNGQESITKYEVINEFEIKNQKISTVKCYLETGRTHQIRVHMSSISHPLLGDDLYGGNKKLINRQALHSFQITFIHPIIKEQVFYEAPIPYDFNL